MIDYNRIFSRFPELETKNLKLRQFTAFDIWAYKDICHDLDFMNVFTKGRKASDQEIINIITTKYPQTFNDKKDITWAIVLKGAEEKIIGLRDVFIDSPYKPVETQGFISKQYRNKGYHQEVLLEVIKFLRKANAEELVINCNKNNEQVKHIAKKLNFEEDFDMSMFGSLSNSIKFILDLQQ